MKWLCVFGLCALVAANDTDKDGTQNREARHLANFRDVSFSQDGRNYGPEKGRYESSGAVDGSQRQEGLANVKLEGFHPHINDHGEVKAITITKEVRVPYPVTVEKKVPYEVKVQIAKPYPVYVPKPFPVIVETRVPYEVPEPQPVPVEQRVPVPVKAQADSIPVKTQTDKPYPVELIRQYPLYFDKRVPFQFENNLPYPLKAPAGRPFPPQIPVNEPAQEILRNNATSQVTIPADKLAPRPAMKPIVVPEERPIAFSVEKPLPAQAPVSVEVHKAVQIPFSILYGNSGNFKLNSNQRVQNLRGVSFGKVSNGGIQEVSGVNFQVGNELSGVKNENTKKTQGNGLQQPELSYVSDEGALRVNNGENQGISTLDFGSKLVSSGSYNGRNAGISNFDFGTKVISSDDSNGRNQGISNLDFGSLVGSSGGNEDVSDILNWYFGRQIQSTGRKETERQVISTLDQERGRALSESAYSGVDQYSRNNEESQSNSEGSTGNQQVSEVSNEESQAVSRDSTALSQGREETTKVINAQELLEERNRINEERSRGWFRVALDSSPVSYASVQDSQRSGNRQELKSYGGWESLLW